MKTRLLLALVLWPAMLLAQNKTADSLLALLPRSKNDTSKVTLLNKISVAYATIDSTKSFQYAQQALQTATQLDWPDGKARAYFRMGSQHSAENNYDKDFYFFNLAIKSAKDKRLQSKIYTGIGNSHMFESHYSKALESYHRALKIDESLRDREGIGKTAINIASVYYSIKDYPKSIAFFNRALNQKIKDPETNAALLRNLGAVYNTMGEIEKALVYFERSLELCRQIGNQSGQASLLSDIALAYYDLEDYTKAIRYSEAALEINTAVEDKVNIAFSFGIIGDSYIEKSKKEKNRRILLDSAVHYLHKSIALHRELNSIRGLYDDYTSLTEAQKLQGNFQTAISSYETAILYKDSIFNTDNRETIKNLEDKRAIELRDKELKISNLRLEANQRQKWVLSLGIVFLGIIGGLLYYQSASRKETNRQLNAMNADLDRANHIKTRLLSILNHDLRSPVNSFIHYIQFRKESPELLDEAAKVRIENATLESAKNLLHSMEDMLLWSKDQMKNFEPQPQKFNIRSVFESIEKHFSAVTDTPIQFESESDFEIDTDENYLKTIMRNLTANALNATREQAEPKIVWRAWENNGKHFFSITDNGPGMSAEKIKLLYDANEVSGVKSGLGLHLVRDLAKAIHYRITAESDASGTTFTLSMA